MEQVRKIIEKSLCRDLYQIILSNPKDESLGSKLKVRPVLIKNELYFQETRYAGTQVFHHNYDKTEMEERLADLLTRVFKQGEIETRDLCAVILVSKKGKATVKMKRNVKLREQELSHNRTKKYILDEGSPAEFLIELGVQNRDGRIVKAKYDKFKQINRYLEFIRDILPILPKDRTVNIVDFGCGKSYLTFAVYHYLKIMLGYDIHIIGLDLKEEVIKNCSDLSRKLGYEGLEFCHGDIGSFKGLDRIDMVVTLHACDTATDYALEKAVNWGALVILSVPCCQHEVNRQISCAQLQPILKYGLLKERMSALITDAIRANLLEQCGYDTQILEFIDMEHTPKNLLIRAVRRGENYGLEKENDVKGLTEFLHIHPTLQTLLDRGYSADLTEKGS